MNQDLVAIKMTAHAVVGSVFPNTPPVFAISVVPKARALGFVQVKQTEAVLPTAEMFKARLVAMLAGTAAVRLIEGDVSEVTYADDLAQVYSIARYMVDHGMSDLDGKGYEIDYEDFHAEVERIVAEAKEMAERLVECERERIEAVAATLRQRETIYGDEFAAILAEHPSRVTPDMVDFKTSFD